MRLPTRAAIVVLLMTGLAACAKWNSAVAPEGFAVVREHVISAPGNDPPISSTLDFTLTAVDGQPVTRETLPRFVHLQRGALVTAGTHEFTALVSPHLRPPNHQPKEVVFTATVQSTKVYYLVDKAGEPVLVAAKARSQ